MIQPGWLYPLALLADSLVGDPRSRLHPVVLIGNLIARLEQWLRAETDSAAVKRWKGGVLVLIVLASVYGTVWLFLRQLADWLPAGALLAVEAFLLAFTISPRSLAEAGLQIRRCFLAGDIDGARQRVGYIVGRDVAHLDEKEITRATVETMAENIVDGVISPLFYAWLGGAPLAFLYRAVNTMDSMLGYRNERYLDFGRVAARTDDVFNYVPARITGLLIVIASFLLRRDARRAAATIWRDAAKHPSPNSGISEAGVAGALGVQLGGLNYYGGVASRRAELGDSLQPLQVNHIRQTAVMIYAVTGLFILLLSGLARLGLPPGWLL